MTSAIEVATMGDNCIDLYLPPLAKSSVGGQSLNVAVMWARMGWKTQYLGAVGADSQGRRITSALANEGVDISAVQVLARESAQTTIEILPNGDRVLLIEDQGACAEYAPTPAEISQLAGVKYLHAANLPNFRAVLAQLRKLKVPMSYDFSTHHEVSDLEGLDIAFYSTPLSPEDPNLELLAKSAHKGGVSTVVITCGEHGSVVFENGTRTIVRAPSIDVIDSCGAGDTYAAVLISERLKGTPLTEAMVAATSAASKNCLHFGPWEQEFEAEPNLSISQ